MRQSLRAPNFSRIQREAGAVRPVGPWSFPWSLSAPISHHLRAAQGPSRASHHLSALQLPPSNPVSPITGKACRSAGLAGEPARAPVVWGTILLQTTCPLVMRPSIACHAVSNESPKGQAAGGSDADGRRGAKFRVCKSECATLVVRLVSLAL